MMRTCAVVTLLVFVALGPLLAEEKPAGQVIVLVNDVTLQGQVQRVEKAFHIRTERGTTILPANQVQRVLGSLEEAYAFLRGRANLRDPDERCRLARWCRSVGLEEEARIEVEVALALRPDHAQARQMQAQMQEVRRRAAVKPPVTPTPSSPTPSARPVSTPDKTARPLTLEGWDHALSGPLFVQYTRKIQPILFNGCGTGACHGNREPAPGDFALRRPYDPGSITAYLTRQNLAQTLQLIDRKDSSQSKLLKMAVTPHGHAKYAPLIGTDSPAYHQLEAWVAQVAPKPASTEGVFASKGEATESPPREPQPADGRGGFAAKHTPGPTAQEAPVLQVGHDKPLNPEKKPSEGQVRRDAFGSPLEPGRPPGADLRKPKSAGLAAWMPGKLFAAPKEPPPGTASVTELPDWVAAPSVPSADPYDPAPFNRHFHGRPDGKTP